MLQSFLKSIPQSRILIYALVLGSLPFLYAAYHYYSQRQAIFDLQSKVESVRQQAVLKQSKQSLNLAVRIHYLGADHFYIDKHVETIPLLDNEVEALEKILNQQYLIENESAKKRLEQLKAENRIAFSEGSVESHPYFHETVETLLKPVETNVEDLLQILSRIEGVDFGQHTPGPNRPQLIITDFKIDKKKTGDSNEVFVLNLKLLKREFF